MLQFILYYRLTPGSLREFSQAVQWQCRRGWQESKTRSSSRLPQRNPAHPSIPRLCYYSSTLDLCWMKSNLLCWNWSKERVELLRRCLEVQSGRFPMRIPLASWLGIGSMEGEARSKNKMTRKTAASRESQKFEPNTEPPRSAAASKDTMRRKKAASRQFKL